MDIIISQHTTVQTCSCSIITQSLHKVPKAICPGKDSHQAPESLLPKEPLLMEKASSTKTIIKGKEGMRSRSGGREVGSTCPPILGTGPTLYELPASSEGDTSAGQSRDLRKV